MSPRGKGPEQFIPEQKNPTPSSTETIKRLTKELFSPEKLGYIKNVIRKLRPGIQEADRDDIVQETLITMNRNIQNGNFDEKKSLLTTYLFRVIRSRLTDLHRKKQRHPTLELDKFNITDTKTNQGEWIEKAYVAGMVSQLPAREKKVVEFMLQGHDYAYIAQEMNITIMRARSIFFEAKKMLKEIIAADTEKNKL